MAAGDARELVDMDMVRNIDFGQARRIAPLGQQQGASTGTLAPSATAAAGEGQAGSQMEAGGSALPTCGSALPQVAAATTAAAAAGPGAAAGQSPRPPAISDEEQELREIYDLQRTLRTMPAREPPAGLEEARTAPEGNELWQEFPEFLTPFQAGRLVGLQQLQRWEEVFSSYGEQLPAQLRRWLRDGYSTWLDKGTCCWISTWDHTKRHKKRRNGRCGTWRRRS